MLQNPFEVLREIGKKKVETDGKRNEFIHAHVDSFTTWLVGFAFSALCLISSNIGTIKIKLGSNSLPIIICFFLTIIIGLIVKYLSYLILFFYKDLQDNYFTGVYGDWDMTPIEADEEIDLANYEEIVRKLKDDFNETILFPRELNETEKHTELLKLIEHYKALCNHAKKYFDIGIKHLSEIYETAYKIDKQATINQFKKGMEEHNIGYNMVRWERFRGCLYLMCILSFIIAISIVVIHLLTY